ncbi:MAG: TIGR03790 family protein [Bryobacterales bacterium]|nr:TIGR03790 family protein [Bryobacterales bacterium]
MRSRLLFLACALVLPTRAQKPENVLIVANQQSPVSKSIAEYYARARHIPQSNVVYLHTTPGEQIPRQVYDRQIAAPIARFLTRNHLQDSILYIVTTLGVPLAITGSGDPKGTDAASVDSELALLYADMHAPPHRLPGLIPNPMFGKPEAKFDRKQFPLYLVTRLAAYDFSDVRAMIDRSLAAVNRGRVVLDLRSSGDATGDEWLRDAAIRLPAGRVFLEETSAVVYHQRDVIGYASWGSNDFQRKQRFLGFQWLPGAIATDFVSTNARTFEPPPGAWTLGTWNPKDQPKWFHGSPQSLSADYIRDGATAASGNVFEPFLANSVRPDYLFPAYLKGRNLAESFYTAIPSLSWMTVVLGDPLCRLAPPR